MQIDIIRLLLDFGLVVLIWIIQRIVYPSFLHYNTENLVRWHRIYTSRFSTIVIPLMFGQLGISIYQVFTNTSFYTVSSLVIIILIWISTFAIFVPIHAIISNENSSEIDLGSLVNKNWMRTILWTLLFIYSFFEVLDF
ncbi:hypothetical protein [Gillisia sp. CAL575]|uniref:hypothetical protein n=1 Tax=Gillisia sp. CAL575 TaxID=985255 RepID=UPI000555C9C8|nr:hypothetical protein [Gillisia sp. CAL575]